MVTVSRCRARSLLELSHQPPTLYLFQQHSAIGKNAQFEHTAQLQRVTGPLGCFGRVATLGRGPQKHAGAGAGVFPHAGGAELPGELLALLFNPVNPDQPAAQEFRHVRIKGCQAAHEITAERAQLAVVGHTLQQLPRSANPGIDRQIKRGQSQRRRHFVCAEFVPVILFVDFPGIVQGQVFNVQVRIGVCGHSVFRAAIFAPAHHSRCPVAPVMVEVLVTPLMADDDFKSAIKHALIRTAQHYLMIFLGMLSAHIRPTPGLEDALCGMAINNPAMPHPKRTPRRFYVDKELGKEMDALSRRWGLSYSETLHLILLASLRGAVLPWSSPAKAEPPIK